MQLEDVLRQNVQLEDFLQSLVAAHAKALRDQGLLDRLDSIRKDILICFNDLATLNGMLISCDGQVREEINSLQKCKQKVGKLARKRRQLLEKRDQWDRHLDTDTEQFSSIPLVIDASYRSVLDKYMKLVSDSDNTDGKSQQESTNGNSPDKIWQSLKALHSSREGVSQSIRQATELLHDFQKDQDFIEKEIRTQSARVRRKVNTIDEEINKCNAARRELMAKVGLPLPTSKEPSTAQRLLHLKLSNAGSEESQAEEEDIADHAEEFIDMKIASLQDQLRHKKENSSSLAVVRDLWNDCIESVKRLEDQIKTVLSGNPGLSTATSGRMKSWIEQSLQELTDLIGSTDNEILIKLVSDEREVIEKAYHEITKSMGTTESDVTPNNTHSNPPFLVASKSPPKIGVSDKTAQRFSNDDNATTSSSLTLLKDKSKKKE